MTQSDAQSLIRGQALIAGRWTDAGGGATFPVTNPATGEIIAEVADCGVAETVRAVEAAAEAQRSWRGVMPRERADLLLAWRERILARKEALARLITLEQGKPIAEARGEVSYGCAFLQWFAEEAPRINGETIPAESPDKRYVVIKQPVGVTAAITPWNFPFAMIARKIAPALAAGCAMVVKPAEQTPLTALAVAGLADGLGFPPGLFSFIPCSDPAGVGEALCRHRVVRKISFTGSTEVGKLLLRQSAETVKKVTMELGGHAPFLVFDDADLDQAVAGAMASKYRNAGQTCVCANRLLVQRGVHELFAGKLTEAVRAIKVGPGNEAGTEQGPLIDGAALAKVERHIEDALAKGAKVLTGGKRHALGGTFFEPTVLSGVTGEMAIAREETFGPVAPIIVFDDEEEAIAISNDTPYGLSSYAYTRDIGRVWRVSEGLEFGMVGVNTGVFSTPVVPFGGIKESGLGREGARVGIDEYLELKYICMAGIG